MSVGQSCEREGDKMFWEATVWWDLQRCMKVFSMNMLMNRLFQFARELCAPLSVFLVKVVCHKCNYCRGFPHRKSKHHRTLYPTKMRKLSVWHRRHVLHYLFTVSSHRINPLSYCHIPIFLLLPRRTQTSRRYCQYAYSGGIWRVGLLLCTWYTVI